MTQDRDVRLMLDGFFADGATRAPDRLMLVVTDRIEHQGQRPGWLVRRDATPSRPWIRPAARIFISNPPGIFPPGRICRVDGGF